MGFYVVCIAFKVQCSNTIEYDPKKKLFKDLLWIFFPLKKIDTQYIYKFGNSNLGSNILRPLLQDYIFFWMKNDQEGGIKTDHFLTLDFYYNRGRKRAYHFQKMDQLQRVRQSIFISMLYTTHYTFFVWYKFYSLPPFFYPPTSLRSLQIFFVGHFFLPLQFLRGELIGWEWAHTKGPNHLHLVRKYLCLLI